MKKLIILFLLNSTISLFAQQPEVSFKDLGFAKKVKKVETYSYSLEDKMVIDKSSDSYDFDENGNIIHHEYHIFGKYASSTSENSTYKNGLLVKREILVKNRPNFNAILTYEYDKAKNLIKKTYKSAQFKNDFLFYYDEKNRLTEIKGIYANNYSVEKFHYHKEKLVKSVNQYFTVDNTIQSETIKLYIDEKVVLEHYSLDKFLKAYVKNNEENIIFQMNVPELNRKISEIEMEIRYKKLNNERLKDWIMNDQNQPYRKIEIEEIFKNNANNDWIVKADIDNRFGRNINYIFRKITYADGSVSGSIDFDIFSVNELKTKINE